MAWRRARSIARKNATHCSLCGGPLDPNALPRTKGATSVDHVYPLATLDLSTHEGRALAVDQAYLRVAHQGCNASRGAAWRARQGPPQRRADPLTQFAPRLTSRDWSASADGRADAHGWLEGDDKPEVHSLTDVACSKGKDADRELSADIPPRRPRGLFDLNRGPDSVPVMAHLGIPER